MAGTRSTGAGLNAANRGMGRGSSGSEADGVTVGGSGVAGTAVSVASGMRMVGETTGGTVDVGPMAISVVAAGAGSAA